MKTVSSIILIMLFSYALSLVYPSIIGAAVVALLVSYFMKLNGLQSFLSGLIGIGILWGSTAYLADAANNYVLSAKVAELIGGLSGFMLIALTILVGGLAGGLGGWTGSSLHNFLKKG